ncbi:MAG: tyrosine-type recombinase/integrase [Lachnospiraceae bacterium]|nr:tyrosine-type recombinase/integrase [Lachnospiraceae bacterium]
MKKKNRNLYERKITLGRDPDGKLVRKSIYAVSKAELEKNIFAARQEWLAAAPKVTEEITFSTYARKWLDTHKAGKSLNTRYMYNFTIEHYINPVIGDLYFTEIKQSDLLELMASFVDRYETSNKIRLTLRQIVAAAEDEGLVPVGVLKPSKLTLPKKPPSKKRALTQEEISALFTADLTDKERLFVLILYYTGLRKEETLALTAGSLDLKEKTLTVSQVRIRDGNDAILEKAAKTDTSLRTIPLPDACLSALSSYVSGHSGFLFGMGEHNALMTEGSFRRFWGNITRKLSEIAPSAAELTPHLFRHNYATMLYYSNISLKMAARLMGHSSTAMITRIYAHLDERKENTAEKLNAIFS